MKVTSNPIAEKQTSLERQLRSKEMPSSMNPSIKSTKFDEKVSEKNSAKNETSQYLMVLSRIENLLIQNKLPDAAIEGFAGAVKKQIDTISEEDKQILMKIPELKTLELDDLDDIPEMIKNDIRNQDKNKALLKLLRLPEFANLMLTDNKPSPKIYTAQKTLETTTAKHEGKILSDPAPYLEKPTQTSSSNVAQNINQNVNASPTNTGG